MSPEVTEPEATEHDVTQPDANQSTDKHAFKAELQSVLGEAQAALRAVIDQIPGKLGNAADLRRALDLDSRLSTQLYKLLRAPNVIEVAADVPGGPSFRRFLAAATARGVSAEALARLERAMAVFERFVAQRAGDRTRFDSIAVNLGARGEEALELEHRRAAHRAMSHLLGMQLREYYRASIIVRASAVSRDSGGGGGGGGIDLAQVRGFTGVERLRPGASIPLFSSRLLGVGMAVPEGLRRSLELGQPVGETTARLIRQAGGTDHVRVVEQLGAPQVELQGDELGAAGAASAYFAELDRNVPVHLVPQEETVGVNHAITVPAERLVMDFIVERDLLKTAVTANVYLNRAGRSAAVFRPEDRLHDPPELAQLRDAGAIGRDLDPGYGASVGEVLESLGWRDRSFVCYRLDQKYPVMGTFVRLGARILG